MPVKQLKEHLDRVRLAGPTIAAITID